MTREAPRFTIDEAMRVLHAARTQRDLVITTMSAARAWMELGTASHDLVLVPSAMGHATSFGLGLALAQPTRRVIVCNGDGSMLMNLGALATIQTAAPPNLVVIVCDNGVYQVTGSQPTPGAGVVDFAAMARACGFPSVFRFDALDAWTRDIDAVLSAPAPTFVTLDLIDTPGTPGPRSPGPAGERARKFMDALSSSA
jgi:sulfopyruvate decarboxylase subunit beta